jgi:hypothetical protein
MAGFMPAIHYPSAKSEQAVGLDGRDKHGHDESWAGSLR